VANKDFNKNFFPEGNLNKKLGGLIFDFNYNATQSYIHFPNYYIIWNKGIAQTLVMDYRFGIIRRKVNQNELPFYDAWLEKPDTITKNYQNLDYLLVRGSDKNTFSELFRKFRLLKKSGDWSVFEKIE
jgi:hypothetical protein